jgi:hypothetical protein
MSQPIGEIKEQVKYLFRYFIEWGGNCLWPKNAEAQERFGYPADPHDLPLTAETIIELKRIEAWYQESLNWDYPPDPGPWRQDECDRFNRASKDLLERIRFELGPNFEVIDQQPELKEDPDLDSYLANPKVCTRKKQ